MADADVPKGKDEVSDQYEERIKQLESKIAELEKQKEEKPRHGQSIDLAGSGISLGGSLGGKGDGISAGGIVEGVLGQFIPGLGGLIKALESSSPEFRQKIADTDSEIKHRIDVGWSNKPVVDYSISTRPMGRGRRTPVPRQEVVKMPQAGPEREPIVDVIDGNEFVTVIAELPGVLEESLSLSLDGSDLLISAGDLSKRVPLPCKPKCITDKSFRNGILQLRIDREKNAN